MRPIHELSKRYKFKIIEDASHAIGGKYLGRPIGGCQYSEVTIFSFHPVKIITTAEGGMALTNNAELAGKMDLLRSHGITRDPKKMTHIFDGPWYYQQIDLGFNYRMTELQAALGVSQLGRLDEYVARRHILAKRYDELLHGLPVTSPMQSSNGYSSFHLYVIRLHLDKIDRSRLEVFEFLRNAGVGVNVHYIPIHTQPLYQKMGFKLGDYPSAERYYSEAVSLPLFPSLSNSQQDDVVRHLIRSLGP
jgi:dTDP-4-amino-4,6-dideoxygalactose transaminase